MSEQLTLAPPRRKAWPHVFHEVRAKINNGSLQPGDRLPNQEDMAREYEVGRGAVKRALWELGAAGLVKSRQGSGTYVEGPPAAGVTEASEMVTVIRKLEEELKVLGARVAYLESAKQHPAPVPEEAAVT